MPNSSTAKPRDTLLILCGLVLVTACLYWARQVLIPVSLAVLLAFILTPAVSALQRRGLGRLPSVLIVVILALLLLSGIGYVISRQINTLVANLPNYKDEIITKVEALRGAGEGGFLGRVQHFLGEISEQLTQSAEKKEERKQTEQKGKDKGANTEEQEPQPGETPAKPLYVQTASSGWTWAAEAIGPAAEGLGDAFLILILVIFMLMRRENLRNRLVRLIGHGRLIVTTQAFDEGAQRISRYLLMLLAINTIFGVTLAVGLLATGLLTGHRQLWQYALLWGFLAAVLRFVPYLGTWIAAAFVTGFSIATLPGWGLPLVILGFFAVIELLTANVVEPLLFGHSTGVSPLALLLAAAFWIWLWGPLGLILSTPLTVILVVLGKYVPELHFFEVLLGDEPVLSTDVTFYQRLVARDLDEAADLVEEYLGDHSPEAVYEEVLLPALLHAKRDRERGELETDDYGAVIQGIRDNEEDLAAVLAAPPSPPPLHGGGEGGATGHKAIAVGCPGHDEADELALRMLGQMMRLAGYSLEVVSSEKLCAEVLGQLAQQAPAVVVIGSLPPGGLAQARYLCKRIRRCSPSIKILVGRWGEMDKNERREKRLLAAGADQVATTLHESLAQIVPLLQVVANTAPAGSEKPELVTSR
jgi:predicted PurR-regulated permease PerM